MTLRSPGLRLLWVLPYLPWPLSSGGKTRQYHLLRGLATRGHRITLLAQSKTPLDAAARAALEPWLERLVVLPRRPVRHPLTLAAVAFARCPMLASINGFAPAARSAFATLLEESWDVIQLEHSYGCQPYLELLESRRLPWILTEHNLESALGGATYGRLPAWLKGFARYDQGRYRRWERRVMGAADRIVAVTPDDARLLQPLTARQISVVVNAVDTQFFAKVRPDSASQRLLFIGNYEYAPNLDAVEWLVAEIMPLLWRTHPRARLQIGGYAMPARWVRDFPDPRLEWCGYLPDLRDAQCRSALFIAPLRQGGGSKLKVLEALAAGLPVVSTAQGVSGLALRNKQEASLAEEAASLARAAADLLGAPVGAARMGEAGRAYVRAHHDWQTAASQLEAVYQGLLPPKEHRPCA
ncbi:glycosyltransferase involved in cell wall biosynthesis [Pseudomonas sp. JUb52]|nr:glycosyltransferase involved in cell wall biosynthesis [Pseudomonas sp. JUb52]